MDIGVCDGSGQGSADSLVFVEQSCFERIRTELRFSDFDFSEFGEERSDAVAVAVGGLRSVQLFQVSCLGIRLNLHEVIAHVRDKIKKGLCRFGSGEKRGEKMQTRGCWYDFFVHR